MTIEALKEEKLRDQRRRSVKKKGFEIRLEE